MAKYRENKIKQEHTIIEDILPLLEDIAKIPYVKHYTGRINRRKGAGYLPIYRYNMIPEWHKIAWQE